MTIWPPQSGDLARPAFRSLADCLGAAIETGQLVPGERLPTHRDLAFELGLSVQTVSRAYVELIRRGLVVGEVGRGSFVRRRENEGRWPFQEDGQAAEFIDCSILQPVSGRIQQQAMRRALMQSAESLTAASLYSFRPAIALGPYLDAALVWLERCGLRPKRGMVHFTNGSTAAMTVALMTAARNGDLVATEAIGHHTLKALTGYLGLRLCGLEIDEEGIVPQAFEQRCQRDKVRVLFVMPSGLCPMAGMMGDARRAELVEIARRHDVMIAENDAWGPLQPERPAPIAAIAPERTFYFTGFSKCLLPALRTGYLVAPEHFGSATANRLQVTNWIATPLMADIVARWIDDGTAEELLAWQKSALSTRNALAAQVLGERPFCASPNGLHVWLPLPPGWNETAFVAHARLNGVAVAPGSAFMVDPTTEPGGVRVCLGMPTIGGLNRALEILARMQGNRPDADLLTI